MAALSIRNAARFPKPWRIALNIELPELLKQPPQRSAADDDWSDEETNDPLFADQRNFYKVEKWTGKDTSRLMLYPATPWEGAVIFGGH